MKRRVFLTFAASIAAPLAALAQQRRTRQRSGPNGGTCPNCPGCPCVDEDGDGICDNCGCPCGSQKRQGGPPNQPPQE